MKNIMDWWYSLTPERTVEIGNAEQEKRMEDWEFNPYHWTRYVTYLTKWWSMLPYGRQVEIFRKYGKED